MPKPKQVTDFIYEIELNQGLILEAVRKHLREVYPYLDEYVINEKPQMNPLVTSFPLILQAVKRKPE